MRKLRMAFAALMLMGLLVSTSSAFVSAATPPEPTYGPADVDGAYTEWDLTGDFFADMYRAAKHDKPVESKLYLRYDCSTGTLYALVLAVHGVFVRADMPSDAYIKIENPSPPPDDIKLVDGNFGDNGTPPDFKWITFMGLTKGWEASAYLPEGSYTRLNVHTQVWHDGSQTSAVEDRHIPLVIQCPVETGTIIVHKVADFESDQEFPFTSDIPGYGNFSLVDDGTTADTITASNLNPDSYDVTELLPAGWNLTDITCVDADNGTQVDLNTATASVDLDPGETVECTFSNARQPGTIIVHKVADFESDQEFPFTSTIPDHLNFSLVDDGAGPGVDTVTFSNLPTGSYNVAEVVPDGWDLVDIQCTDPDEGTDVDLEEAKALIDLDPGETVECTFNNDPKPGTIIIEKVTDPAGLPNKFDFTDNVKAPNSFELAHGQSKTFSNVTPGTYIVTEDNPALMGFTLDDLVCQDSDAEGIDSTTDLAGRTATINLDPEETVTCYFTNKAEPGTIIVHKVADLESDEEFPFTSTIPDHLSFSLVDDGAGPGVDTVTFSNLPIGSYDVAEVVPDGWNLVEIECTHTDPETPIDEDSSGISIDLGPDEIVECTFYNDPQPGTIIIEKVTDPAGLLDQFDFTHDITQIPFSLAHGESQTFEGVEPGQYTVTEDDPSLVGKFSLIGLVCQDSDTAGTPSTTDLLARTATINLDPGETVTCRFTNKKEGPDAVTLASFAAEAGIGSVTLAWETGTEIDNAGFNLYRATAPDGPYTKVNDALIAATGDPVSGANYSLLDKGLAPGTYYYKLEDVDLNGVATLHGPVSATVTPQLRRPAYRPTLPGF